MARRRRVSYHLRAEPGGRHYLMLYGLVCRFTVGHDLVGTSVAVGERVSPQRSPFEGAVRASRIASSVFVVPSHPPGGRVLSGARLSVTRWSGACQLRMCVCC